MSDRLRELAYDGAKLRHYGAIDREHEHADFETCPHPDCVLVRSPAASPDAADRKPFKLDVSKEWCEKMASLEDGSDVTAGSESTFQRDAADGLTDECENCGHTRGSHSTRTGDCTMRWPDGSECHCRAFEEAIQDHQRAARAGDTSPSPAWQPIETAPKDGTPVLVFMLCRAWHYELVALASWTDHNGGGWVSYHPGIPTHWMPLPDPPVRAGEAPPSATTGEEQQP